MSLHETRPPLASTARRPGRPRGANADGRRQEIIDAATIVFGRDGYRGASMSSIARAAGISPTGLVHHFPDIESLLLAVLTERNKKDLTAIGALLDTLKERQTHRGWAYVDLLVDLMRHNERQPQLVRLFTTIAGEAADPSHPAAEWLRGHHDGFFQNIRWALEEAEAMGDLAEGAPIEEIARISASVMDGLQIQWLVRHREFSMADSFAAYVEMLKARWKV
jgi:AcrR family transcriptional regulator